MKTTIDFGKVDYEGIGKKTNKITVELQLKDTTKGQVFTASGGVWGSKGQDYIIVGQCIDELADLLPDNQLMQDIYYLWDRYHLNDMNAGDEIQTLAVKRWLDKGNKYDYNEVCDHLDSLGILEHNGYRYGTAWKFRKIPLLDLVKIQRIIENSQNGAK